MTRKNQKPRQRKPYCGHHRPEDEFFRGVPGARSTVIGRAFPNTMAIMPGAGPNKKMSAVLLDFLDPYIKKMDEAGETNYRNLIVLGIIAWNASFLPERKRRAMLMQAAVRFVGGKSFFRHVVLVFRLLFRRAPDGVYDLMDLLNDMAQRKLEHYADIDRKILDYSFNETDTDIQLFVVSTV